MFVCFLLKHEQTNIALPKSDAGRNFFEWRTAIFSKMFFILGKINLIHFRVISVSTLERGHGFFRQPYGFTNVPNFPSPCTIDALLVIIVVSPTDFYYFDLNQALPLVCGS